MDDDLEATATIASMTSPVAAVEAKGKACAPRKAVAPPKKKKKELIHEERGVELDKRKGRRHAQDASGEPADATAITAAAQQEDTTARVKVSLLYLGVVLDGFPLDHEFPEDYGLEEEDDDMDIDGEPLFEDELANQIDAGAKPKCKSKQTKAYMPAEDKVIFECWRDIGKDPKVGAEQKWSALWTRVHREFHERKKFPRYQMQSKCGWVSFSKRSRVIQQECNKFCATYESIKAHPVSGLGMQDMVFQALEAFKAQYAALLARGGKEAVEDHGDDEKARSRGKPNSKKDDRRDAASITLLEKMKGMISKKDLREEKRRQEQEEKMHALMQIQRRRLEMDAERQAKMLELGR
ncbi:Lectin-domain containing receptor kinase A4.3 [Hordeum vulgare]|nr:Lectin-domain containing receptor kinase A4.3 [Hordeum vulgare]